MAGVTEYPILTLTKRASGSITKNRFVKVDGSQNFTANGEAVLGVANDSVSDGEVFPVIVIGKAVVEAGGAVNAGDYVIADTQGRAISASNLAVAAGTTSVTSTAANGEILTGSVPPEKIAGFALTSASAAGDLIEIIVFK